MNTTMMSALQFAAWFLTLVEFVLAIYVLLLNAKHIANRHVSALLFLFSANTFALSLMLGSVDPAPVARAIFAATVPAIPPALFLVAVVLLKPQWLHGRSRWFWWPIYGLVFLPIIATVVDVALNTQLWYTGLSPEAYLGGFVASEQIATGLLSPLVTVVNFYVMGIASPLFLLYVSLLDKEATPSSRRLAWLLLSANIAVLIVQYGFRNLLGTGLAALLSTLVYVSAYAYVGFQQMISERRAQTGRLQDRLMALVLALTVPILIAVIAFVSYRAADVIEIKTGEQLGATNRGLVANVSVWLELNVQSLQQLVSLPDIVSMDAQRQKPILEAHAAAFPQMYLVSTTDLNGINVARNDAEDLKDYGDRPWFQEARDGAPLTFQTLAGRTSGESALVASMPIRNESGEIVGVGMFASDLTDLAREVAESTVGETGFAFVVNAQNQVVAHPDSALPADLRDLSDYPPIAALRKGAEGLVAFTDENGEQWRAYVREAESGWGVVVQVRETEFRQDAQAIAIAAGAVAALGVLMVLVLAWFAIRQAIQPIDTLMGTATAIASGDLDRVALVESEDEIGVLARAFNSMTEQLRRLVGSLEQQVADRTRDLQQRTAYLEAAADVGRAAASILEIDPLLQQVVDLIRERFGLYYVGLFLVDAAAEWAVLRAGTGEAGRAMLNRDHRIRVGEGMIGWSVAHAQSRVALEAGVDAVRLATLELPDTRSEAALPLRSRGRVLGALTVQHIEPDAFGPDIMAVLQIMADQVAVALDNARLFTESQEALETARQAYGDLGRRAWSELLRGRANWGYRYTRQRVVPVQDEARPEMLQAERMGQIVQDNGVTGSRLAIPLKVRDEVVGVLGFRKGGASKGWSPEELALLEEFADQLGVALESARLYQETRRRAAQEQLTSQITARMRQTLDVQTVLQTAVREIGEALQLHDLAIQLEVDGAQVDREEPSVEQEVL